MSERWTWHIKEHDGVANIHVSGFIDEDSDFRPLIERLKEEKHLCFELAEVHHMNSCGVREWLRFMREVSSVKYLEFRNCSPTFVAQVNMISNFCGTGRVISVQAPYVCLACAAEARPVISINYGTFPALPQTACTKCNTAMEFDDIESSYFAFVHRPPPAKRDAPLSQ